MKWTNNSLPSGCRVCDADTGAWVASVASEHAVFVTSAPGLFDALAIAATTLEVTYKNDPDNIAARTAAQTARAAIAIAKEVRS